MNEIDIEDIHCSGCTMETHPPTTFEGAFGSIFNEAFRLLVERQRKYGPENVRKLGIFGVFGRLADDKVERIRRALNGSIVHGEVTLDDLADFADESFEDALLDIANYALILIALRRGVWGLPLADEASFADEANDMWNRVRPALNSTSTTHAEVMYSTVAE